MSAAASGVCMQRAQASARFETCARQRGGAEPLRATRYAGIDLGTSNSAVAVVDLRDGGARPRIVETRDGATTPSVVTFLPDGSAVVGRTALQAEAEGRGTTLRHFKRLTGMRMQDATAGFVTIPAPAQDRDVLPQEAGAAVIRALLDAICDQTGDTVDRAVVCVPSDFGREAIYATLEAAQLAGVRRAVPLQEPVAAAIAHGLLANAGEELVLVFDLGGGTCDVSLLDCFEGIVEVVATSGDRGLGGTDMDDLLARHMAMRLGLDPEDLSRDAGVWQRWRSAAEGAKLRLSDAEDADFQVPGTSSESHAGPNTRALVTREEFETVVQPLLLRMACGPLRELSEAAKLEWEWAPWEKAAANVDRTVRGRWDPPPRRVTQVVLVGAATKVPCVRGLIERMTGLEVRTDVDPELAVALGAAVHAAVLEGHVSGIEVMDGTYNWDMHQRASGFS